MRSGEIFDIVGAGWRGGINAVRRNIPVFAATFPVMLAISAIFQPMFPNWHHHHHSQMAEPIDLHLWLVETVQTVLVSLAAAPSMVAVHRFVLLNESGTINSNIRRLFFFSAWITAFHFVPSLLGLFADRSNVIMAILSFGIFYCMPRLILSFPTMALDKKSPLLDSWKRSRGHWWKITWVMVLGFLPLFLIIFVMAAANEATRIVMVTILDSTWPAIGAALASELYRSLDGLAPRQE